MHCYLVTWEAVSLLGVSFLHNLVWFVFWAPLHKEWQHDGCLIGKCHSRSKKSFIFIFFHRRLTNSGCKNLPYIKYLCGTICWRLKRDTNDKTLTNFGSTKSSSESLSWKNYEIYIMRYQYWGPFPISSKSPKDSKYNLHEHFEKQCDIIQFRLLHNLHMLNDWIDFLITSFADPLFVNDNA